MYDPAMPTGDPHSETLGPSGDSDGTDDTEDALSTWQPAPFRAQLRVWGFDQVDGGQKNEDGTKGQCFFVSIREAMVAVGEGYAATALRLDARQQLSLPGWFLMADPTGAAEKGLLVREDYRSPILGSAHPSR